MIKDIIAKILKEIVKSELVAVDVPGGLKFGDYSTNIAMILAKQENKNPKELAEKIVGELKGNKELLSIVEKIETAGAGFINFWIKKQVLLKNLVLINKEKDEYGKLSLNKGKLAIVEYSSPNIAKPFTIGHLRSTIIGDAIANLLTKTGWKVLRDNHLGDWGTQFGKMIYAIKTWGDEKNIVNSKNPVKNLVDLYIKFHKEAEKDSSLDDEARSWFKKLEDGDTEARRIWKLCIDLSWKEFNEIYSILGIEFSKEFNGGRGLGESFFERKMEAIIQELKDKNLLKNGKEGAQLVFFEKNKYPPAMILKKDGTTLYHTRDLATDKYRSEKYKPDLIINEVGAEQILYFQQLFEIEKILDWYKEGQRVHILHGLYRFKEGKMSTRKGNVIWMNEVISEAIKKAKKLGSSNIKLAKIVAIGALKYNDLKRDPKTEVIFDWDEILSMEGNSGPYLQYTYARSNSVIHKAGEFSFKSINNLGLNDEEMILLRALLKFKDMLVRASLNYSPNTVCSYLFDLASKYNTFYNSHKIIGSENEELRLTLTLATNQVIKNGLGILGIEVPEKM